MDLIRSGFHIFAATLLCMAALAYSPTDCLAGAYVVELSNGQTLEANDCTSGDGRLHLVYPVGEAYIPLSSVKSVKYNDTEVLSALQSKGVYVPGAPPQPEPAAQAPAPAGTAESRSTSTRVTAGPDRAARRDYSAMQRASDQTNSEVDSTPAINKGFTQTDPEVDKFLDDMSAGKLTDEQVEQKMDALFGKDEN